MLLFNGQTYQQTWDRHEKQEFRPFRDEIWVAPRSKSLRVAEVLIELQNVWQKRWRVRLSYSLERNCNIKSRRYSYQPSSYMFPRKEDQSESQGWIYYKKQVNMSNAMRLYPWFKGKIMYLISRVLNPLWECLSFTSHCSVWETSFQASSWPEIPNLNLIKKNWIMPSLQ